jgi:hypothetical protein
MPSSGGGRLLHVGIGSIGLGVLSPPSNGTLSGGGRFLRRALRLGDRSVGIDVTLGIGIGISIGVGLG